MTPDTQEHLSLSDEARLVAVNEFLSEVFRDRRAGREHGLESYLARHPGHEEALRREWADLHVAAEEDAGERIGPYRIVREIGRGGQGVVYLAEDTRLPRKVALKVLRGAGLLGDEGMARFTREAQALSRLDHPGICSIIDVGRDGDRAYLAMRFAHGRTLARLLDERRQGTVADPRVRPEGSGSSTARAREAITEAVRLIEHCALAVHAAHEAGFLHRDLKPGNIMIGDDGRPLILDFGLAREMGDAATMTQSGDLIGTPAYMAPEQVEGRTDLDRRTDVWALGVTLFEAVSLRHPFTGATRQALYRSIAADALPSVRALIPRISRDLEVVLATATAKERDQRYATAAALAEDLRRVRCLEPITARPVPRLGRLLRWSRRNRALASAVASILVLLVGGGVAAGLAAVVFSRQSDENEALAGQEREARLQAQEIGREARQSLYIAEMNLAGRAAAEPGGIDRVRRIVDRWNVPEDGSPDLRGWEWRYLRALSAREEVITPVGSTCLSLAWHPSEDLIAATTIDTVRILDARTGSVIRDLSFPGGMVFSVAWSLDGTRLAAGGMAGVRVYETASWRQESALLPGAWILALTFDPLGSRLVAHAGNDRTMHVIDLEKGAVVRSISERVQDHGHHYGFSPDGGRFVFAGVNGDIQFWDPVTWEPGATAAGDGWPVLAVVWRPDGGRLASSGFSGRITVRDSATGAAVRTLEGHGLPIRSLAFSPDGRRLLSAGDDYTVRIWDPQQSVELDRLMGHTAFVRCAVWSPDGGRIASDAEDGTVRIWTPRRRQPERRPPRLPRADELRLHLEWTARGEVAASAGAPFRTLAPDADEWTAAEGRHVQATWHRSLGLRATMDGYTVVVRDDRRKIEHRSPPLPEVLVTRLEWHPTDARLGVTSDKALWIWDLAVENSVPVRTLEAGDLVRDFTWCGGGRLIAVCAGSTFRLFDVARGVEVRREELRTYGGFLGVAADPDGARLAVGASDQKIRILDAVTLESRLSLEGHTNSVHGLSWSPDGTRLASGGADGTVRVWETEEGRLLITFVMGGIVMSTAFSPDGHHLAALNELGDVRIWNASPAGPVPAAATTSR